MSIYPTLTDLCGIPTPAHVQGRSLPALLADPTAPWDAPAITTYRRNNHTVCSADWRYTCYADGGEELYQERVDPNEWTNLLWHQTNAPAKTAPEKYLPTDNKPPADSGRGRGAKRPRKRAE